ncbi:MAG: GvpL/GvpF family gas vesicle protein [Actinomycetota bacterium]|nr:GvpL/GvpF family gas vesicle protein [Actinomycetota bacterium]
MRAGDEAFDALRAAIEALADAEAAELVAEARIEARAKVRAILTEALAQALLDRSPAQLSRPPRERPDTGGDRRPPQRGEGSAPTAEPEPPPRERARVDEEAPDPVATSASEEAPDPVRSSASAGELGWYVYCVVGDPDLGLPDSLTTADEGRRLRLVRAGDLAAVANQVPLSEFGEETLRESLNDVAWLERTARAHERVLDDLRVHTTVIPMRLCTIYRSESSVREMLVREHQALGEALARLVGKTEWGVKVFVDPPDVEQAAKQASPELARLATECEGASAGGAYLRRKQLEVRLREETDRLVDACVEDVHSRLSTLAVEALRNPLQHQEASGHGGEMVLNGVYLVDDAAGDEFHACVAALAEQYATCACDLQTTGPWPPYNFVKSSIEAAW